MSNLLSSEEASALLQGIADGSVQTHGDGSLPGEVVPYDFTSREHIVRGQLPALQQINERFARDLRTHLSGLLRSALSVEADGIRNVKLTEYVQTLAVPSSLHTIKADPLPGSGLVVLDPAMVYIAVDSYFGGRGRAPESFSRSEFTPGELRVVQLLIERIIGSLNKAWQSVHPLQLKHVGSEMNPQLVSLAAPGTRAVVSQFGIALENGDAGTLQVVLPEPMLEPVRKQLDSTTKSDQAPADSSAAIGARLRTAHVELSAQLGQTRISLRDLLQLQPGDIVPLQGAELVTMRVGRMPVLRGRFAAYRGQNAVELTERILAARSPDRRPASKRRK